MAKRTSTRKPANTEGENGAGTPADTPILPSVAANQTDGTAGGGGDPAPAAENTQGVDDAEQSVEAPITAPGTSVQEQPGGGDPDVTGALAGSHTDDAVAALSRAVTALGGDPMAIMPIIPENITLEIRNNGFSVRVVGPKRGRRRIGRQFGPEPVLIPLDELSEEDRASLAADPVLSIEIVPHPEISSAAPPPSA